MVKYIVRRLIFLFFVVWAAATLNFFLPRLSGQDPIRQRLLQQVQYGAGMQSNIEEMVEVYNKKFGLDKPLWQQYLTSMGDLARFDLGSSIAYYPQDVKHIIGGAIPWTIGLLSVTTVIAFTIGSLYGALASWERAPKWLVSMAPVWFTFSAIPYYLMGLILLYFLSFKVRWFPGNGGFTMGTIPVWSWDFVKDVLHHSVLPALSIVLSGIGFWALGMRGMLVTVKGEDYMILGEAKGLKNRRLFFRYGLRNALLPQVTSLALALGYVFSGSVLVEVVFGFPGMGTVLFRSIKVVDYPVIQGTVMTIILALAFATLIVDVLLPVLDPRIRRGRKGA